MFAAGYLTGEVPSSGGGEPPFADVDGDGISDTLEATPALQALGFSVGVNDSALFASIYTEDSILDLVTGSQVMIQKNGADVTLSVPLFRSADMSSFTPAPALDATFPSTTESGKEFFRIEVGGAE
jgi:hypothetical protein